MSVRWVSGLLVTVCAAALSAPARGQGTTLPPVNVDPPVVRRSVPVASPAPVRARTAARVRPPRRVAQAPRPQIRPVATPSAPVAERAPTPLPGGTDAGGPRGPVRGYVASRSVVATKTDTPLLETAQSISVIGRKQIDDQVPASINQAMRYTAGVSAEQRGGQGVSRLDLFLIRGFSAPIFVDGLRMPIFRDANPSVDPYRVERIDIVKGPTSTLYGQSGPGGLVNLTSKVPQFVNHGELFVQGGGSREIRTGFDVGGPVPVGQPGSEQFAYRVVGLGLKGEGPIEHTRVERQFIAPSFTWRPSADTTLTILGHYQVDPFGSTYGVVPAVGSVFTRNLGNGISGRLPVRFYDGDRSYEKSDRSQAAITYIFDHSFSESLRFHSAGRYIHSEGLNKSAYGSSTANGPYSTGPLIVRLHGSTDTDIQAFSVDNYLESKFETGPLRHTAVVGVDHYYSDQGTFTSTYPSAPPLNILAPNYFMGLVGPAYATRARIMAEQTGVYLQDQIKLGGFVLTLGGRYDKARNWSETRPLNSAGAVTRQDAGVHAYTGKASLLYLFDFGLAPYAAYSEAFEPITGGRIFDPAYGPLGRIADPTRSKQWEGGVKYQPPGTDILLSSAVFDITQENRLNPDSLRPGQGFSVQAGEVRVQGIEFEARGRIAGFDFTGGLSFLDPKTIRDKGTVINEVTNRQVPLVNRVPVQIPDRTASMFVNYQFQVGPLLGLSLGGGVRHIGSQWGDAANTFKVKDSTLVDAVAKYDFKYIAPSLRGLEVQVNAQNLLDQRYVSSCVNYSWCFYGLGRTVYATVRYRW